MLLDAEDHGAVATGIRRIVEAEPDRGLADLHVWRVGRASRACIVSLVTHTPQPVENYRQRLAGIAGLDHVTIGIDHCRRCGASWRRPASADNGASNGVWCSGAIQSIVTLFLHTGRTSMHAVNVRQLKSNPSVALREAKNGPVVVFNRDTPDAVLVGIEQLGIATLPQVRSALAVSLFRSGDISAATAAKVAQVPLADMLSLLSDLGIPLYGGTPADAAQEIETGARWLATQS